MQIILFDNNDSFTENLRHLLLSALPGSTVRVVPYSLLGTTNLSADLAVISPGPGAPEDYEGYARLLQGDLPVLGVCLGMQIINAHFGGSVERLPDCVHGKTDVITLFGRKHTVARYHSLYCATVGKDLEVLGRNVQQVPMALKHKYKPIVGLQFHPESFLTEDGDMIIRDALGVIDINEL